MTRSYKFTFFPKKGESLIVNNILMVGSSIAIVSNASGFSKSAIVSPISKPSTPTNCTNISSNLLLLLFYVQDLQKYVILLILDLIISYHLFLLKKLAFLLSKHLFHKRPIAIPPVNEEKSKDVINI